MFLKIAAVSLGILVLIGTGLVLSGWLNSQKNSNDNIVCVQDVKVCPDGTSVGRVPPKCDFAPCSSRNSEAPEQIIAENLEIPWAVAFLSDGRLLVTERPGRVRIVEKNGELKLAATISSVKHIGEGGLLGVAVHPDFSTNKLVYLYYTFSGSGNNTLNRVARYKLETGQLTGEQIIVDNIPGASNHNGGRIKFGPDKFLYITTGDAQNPSQSQNKNSLAGKILRVTDEGKPVSGNPFGNLAYSYGHRNPQGLAWDGNNLWATEHGPSTKDEVNLIEAGKNYGWPEIEGDESAAGMEKPVINSGSDTWAPAGAAFYQGSVFFGGLRGSALFEKTANNQLKEHFKNEFGRIREVVLGPDDFLYITTSNLDGRGLVKAGDDKIIKIDPQKL